jgi:hypothetical protein
MSLPLAETAKGIEGGLCHFVVERHDCNPGVLHQFLEKTYRIRSQTREQNNLGFQDGDPMKSTSSRR